MTLLRQDATPQAFALIELSALLVGTETVTSELPVEIQQVLTQSSFVFEVPKGLPPRRKYDHTIPLIPGAHPFLVRPYRQALVLKDELEKQVQEMLTSGIIRHNNSRFSSPMILVQKKDKTWTPVIDYRHLNALTVKSKFPIPIIDELLDELT